MVGAHFLSHRRRYTDKYLGYPLTKGKLVLDVKCMIQRDQLASSGKPTQRLHFVDLEKGRVTSQHKIWLDDSAA